MFGVVRPANFGLYGHNWLTKDIPVFEDRQSLCSKKDNPRVRGKTILVFEERYSLCSKKDIPCVRRRRNPIFWSYSPQEGCIWSKIWCRSWFWRPFRRSSSKSTRNLQKTKFFVRKFRRKKFFCVEKRNVGDRLKRVFPKFGGCTGHVRGVNGRSKFRKIFEICEVRRYSKSEVR